MKFGTRELMFLVVMVGLLFCAWFFVFKPADARILTLRADTLAKQQQIAQLKLAEQRIANMAGKIDELKERIQYYEQRLPKENGAHDLVTQISQKASSNRLLTVPSIRKTPPAKASGYYELPVKVNMQGDFRGFYDFLLRMERMPRIMRINQLKLAKINEKDGSTTADFVISIYYAPDADK